MVTVIVALCSYGAAPPPDPLAGRWRVVSAYQNGVPIFFGPEREKRLARMVVVIGDGEIRVSIEGTKAMQRASYRAAAGLIDLTALSEEDEKEPLFRWKLFRSYPNGPEGKGEGLYARDGDRLTLCWRATKLKSYPLRPKGMESHFYYHQVLFVLERVK
jgi:hypothetical protein